MANEDFDYKKASYEFVEEKPVWKLIFQSIKQEMLPDKKNWFGAAFSVIAGMILAYIVGTSEDTVLLTTKICETFLDVQIAIFGCIFAVYSILLALLSDSYIKKLLHVDYHNRSSYLKASTRYYESALFIYFVAIGVSLILKVAVQCMSEDFVLTNNHLFNEVLACILLLFYFAYSIRAVYELKSIIGNTLLLFRTSLAFKIQTFKEESEDTIEKDNRESNI